ncbi:MAG TPA: hypothetical protein VMP38_05610 [Candidatus Acidoferrum sp.]|nr:hypothetical protein [Candidatus Acidoferrum sp.]
MAEFDVSEFRARLRAAVLEALRSRDSHAIAALRSLASAIDNAEAVGGSSAPGVRIGVGVGDVGRRRLSLADVDRVVASEIGERDEAACEYERLGRVEQADALRAEISFLERFRAR